MTKLSSEPKVTLLVRTEPESKTGSLASDWILVTALVYFVHLLMAVLGLRCSAWASSSCDEQGLLFLAVNSCSLQWLLLLQSTGARVHRFP